MKNIIILDKIFEIKKRSGINKDCIWNCVYNGKIVASLRIYRNGIHKGSWYLCFFGLPWIIVKENKSVTVKAIVLNYILTNFNNL